MKLQCQFYLRDFQLKLKLLKIAIGRVETIENAWNILYTVDSLLKNGIGLCVHMEIHKKTAVETKEKKLEFKREEIGRKNDEFLSKFYWNVLRKSSDRHIWTKWRYKTIKWQGNSWNKMLISSSYM